MTIIQDENYSKIIKGRLREYLNHCYQCATCSGICQMGRVQKYTPSKIIQLIIEGYEDEIVESGILWDCLTCNSCLNVCPHDVNFAEIVRDARAKMLSVGINPNISHKGFYTLLGEVMSKEQVTPERDFGWVPSDCKISDQGEIMYFVGCTPYFDFEFEKSGGIAVDSLKVLCQLEEEPIVLLKNEKCCGHDLLWQGKIDAFSKLASHNIQAIKKSGVSLIITSCAEGYRTLKIDYPSMFDDFNVEVKHLIEYIYDNLKANKIKFKESATDAKDINLTYHDPCRLSRFLPKDFEIYEKSRYVFRELENSGYKFKEMAHNKGNSLCCGVSCWLNCSDKTKALRTHRMEEAKQVADVMVTTCPKCAIHFRCLQNDPGNENDVKIIDLSNLLVDIIEVIDPESIQDNMEDV